MGRMWVGSLPRRDRRRVSGGEGTLRSASQAELLHKTRGRKSNGEGRQGASRRLAQKRRRESESSGRLRAGPAARGRMNE